MKLAAWLDRNVLPYNVFEWITLWPGVIFCWSSWLLDPEGWYGVVGPCLVLASLTSYVIRMTAFHLARKGTKQ